MLRLCLFVTLSFLEHYFQQCLRDYFCSCHLAISCIRKGIQNNSSHIVLCQKSIHLRQWAGCFFSALINNWHMWELWNLSPYPWDLYPLQKNFILWGVNILRSGNKETLATDLKNYPLYRTRRFFCSYQIKPHIRLIVELELKRIIEKILDFNEMNIFKK